MRIPPQIEAGSSFRSGAQLAHPVASWPRFIRAHRGGNLLLGFILLTASAVGCGRESRLDVSPVRGRVTYKGQGVPDAIVIFFPAEDAVEKLKKMRPFAYADDQGNFQMKTYVNGDGAPPGKYRVSIIAASVGRASGGKDDKPGETPSASLAAVTIPPDVTKKYGNVDTAGIEVTVQDGENNLEPFAL